MTAGFKSELRNKEIDLVLDLNYDKTTIYELTLDIMPGCDDSVDYSMDLKIFYYENLDIYNDDLFILGQEIKIPRCIRNYYKGIDDLDLEAQKAFRNAARYNEPIN